MPVSDSASLDVHDVRRKPELARHGDDGRSECLVDFDALDVSELPARPGERLIDGGDRPKTQHPRLDGSDPMGDEEMRRAVESRPRASAHLRSAKNDGRRPAG